MFWLSRNLNLVVIRLPSVAEVLRLVVSTLNSNLSATSEYDGSSAFNAGTGCVLDSYSKCTKRGNVTTVTLNAHLSSEIGAWTTIATIVPAECKPRFSAVYIPYGTPTPTYTLFINTDGTIVCDTAIGANQTIHFTVTY